MHTFTYNEAWATAHYIKMELNVLYRNTICELNHYVISHNSVDVLLPANTDQRIASTRQWSKIEKYFRLSRKYKPDTHNYQNIVNSGRNGNNGNDKRCARVELNTQANFTDPIGF